MANVSTQEMEGLKKSIANRHAKLAENKREEDKINTDIEKEKQESQRRIHVLEAKKKQLADERRRMEQEMHQDEQDVIEIQRELQKITKKVA
ncbi:MAG: hypothetical protein WAP52_01040 [Candidatus Sungiibacteriota bacterium]